MYKKTLILLSLAVSLGACNSEKKQKNETGTVAITEEKKTTQSLRAEEVAGEKIYSQYCLVCHQTNGEGLAGMYPPINESEYVMGEKDTLIGIILNGLSGPIEVKGEKYNNVMPAHDFLTDQQIAYMLTYIRNNFGNKASDVSPQEVAKVRSK